MELVRRSASAASRALNFTSTLLAERACTLTSARLPQTFSTHCCNWAGAIVGWAWGWGAPAASEMTTTPVETVAGVGATPLGFGAGAVLAICSRAGGGGALTVMVLSTRVLL